MAVLWSEVVGGLVSFLFLSLSLVYCVCVWVASASSGEPLMITVRRWCFLGRPIRRHFRPTLPCWRLNVTRPFPSPSPLPLIALGRNRFSYIKMASVRDVVLRNFQLQGEVSHIPRGYLQLKAKVSTTTHSEYSHAPPHPSLYVYRWYQWRQRLLPKYSQEISGQHLNANVEFCWFFKKRKILEYQKTVGSNWEQKGHEKKGRNRERWCSVLNVNRTSDQETGTIAAREKKYRH